MKCMITAVMAALSLALGACAATSTGSTAVDSATLQRDVEIFDIAYSAAKAAVPIFCAAAPKVPPCNSPAAMAQIAKAEGVLDLAWTRAKADILAARTSDDVTIATKAFMDALAVYAKVKATYGVNSGGG